MARGLLVAVLTLSMLTALAVAMEPTPAQRGEQALLGRAFIPPAWSREAYSRLWRYWPEERSQPPRPYDQAILEHYGLHPAPYPGRLPMGLRETTFLGRKGLANDCLLCHASSIAGQSIIGLGNSSLDMQALFEDLNAADGRPAATPFVFSNVRGTTEAGSMSVFLMKYREPDLKVHRPPYHHELRDNLCEDVPAWWLLKKKKTMYHTGSTDTRSVRSLMQFMLSPINSPEFIRSEESTFADIRAYLLTLEPPKYPFSVNATLAHKGEELFRENCARCHGTYGPNGTYPNRIVPIDVIGTDRTRFDGFTEEAVAHFNQSWFAHEKADGYPAEKTPGYQAPPLDGIWATAPYFHNGAAPTVYDVLNSRARPRLFTRSFRTGKEDYDPVKLGWKVQVIEEKPTLDMPPYERRKVYDITQPGRGNSGHTFGDRLTEEERWEVIEYLKTL